MSGSGTHRNENNLVKYANWCRGWINRRTNRNWVDEDHIELFESEKEDSDSHEEDSNSTVSSPANEQNENNFIKNEIVGEIFLNDHDTKSNSNSKSTNTLKNNFDIVYDENDGNFNVQKKSSPF